MARGRGRGTTKKPAAAAADSEGVPLVGPVQQRLRFEESAPSPSPSPSPSPPPLGRPKPSPSPSPEPSPSPSEGEECSEESKAKKPLTEKQKMQMLMVNNLKNQQTAKRATEEEKASAQMALEVYNNLQGDAKNGFLARWNQTKGTKNLDWVKNFKENLVTTQARETEIMQKHMTRLLMHVKRMSHLIQ